MNNDEIFICSVCRKKFQTIRDETWSKEKAIEEAIKNFGSFDDSFLPVCDDCWQIIKPKEN